MLVATRYITPKDTYTDTILPSYTSVQYFETLKKAYGICSKAVHTGFLKNETSTRVLLSNAQGICRKALLKRLDEGGEPDWTRLVLGA